MNDNYYDPVAPSSDGNHHSEGTVLVGTSGMGKSLVLSTSATYSNPKGALKCESTPFVQVAVSSQTNFEHFLSVVLDVLGKPNAPQQLQISSTRVIEFFNGVKITCEVIDEIEHHDKVSADRSD